MLSTSSQASWDNNFPYPQEVVATHLAKVVRDALDRGLETLEVTAEAEAAWVRFHEEKSAATLAECTPSYFNQEGRRTQTHPGNAAGARHRVATC